LKVHDLEKRLRTEGLSALSWSNGPGDLYPAHSHGYDKVLVAAAGSITFHLPELGREVELSAGDRLDLPANTTHAASVGPAGVTCLEAHVPSGSLPGGLRHLRADAW
jgi:quercetin dioxygenase-like cupin family protein